MRVFMSSPVYSYCHPDFVDAFIDTIDEMRDMGWDVCRHPFSRSKGSAQLNLQRSAITEHFLASECDVMIQVDSDQWWKTTDMIALVQAIEEEKTDIAGAAIAIKDDSCKPNVRLPKSAIETKTIEAFRVYGHLFVQVDRIGGGMLAISRKCVQEVTAYLDAISKAPRTPTASGRTPLVFNWQEIDDELESEDYTFVRRALFVGMRAYALADARVHHIGERAFVTKLDDLLMRSHIEVKL